MRVMILQIIKDDFEEPYGRMLMKLLEKYDKYGRSYTDEMDLSYYLKRLKKEIEEYESQPSIEEAIDIANFGLMLVYHHLRLEKEGTESD